MDADLLMFIYLQQFDVTFENNQNDGFCQLVTHNTPSPHLKRKHFKMAKDGPFPCTTNLTPPPPRSPFPSLWPLPVWDCEMILQLGCCSSPHSGRLHCPLQCSLYGHLSCCYPKNGHMERLNTCLSQQPQ